MQIRGKVKILLSFPQYNNSFEKSIFLPKVHQNPELKFVYKN